ncbi:MAG: DMT family transporter [Cytophagaceae bacterium]
MSQFNYRSYLGAVLTFMGAICFSAKAVMVKLAYTYQVDTLSLLTLRMLISLPFFAGIAIYSNRKNPGTNLTVKDWLMVVILGVTGYYLASLFDFEGLRFISAGLERLILFVYPTLVVVLSAIFFKKKIGGKEYLALSLTYIGIAVVFLGDLNLHQKDLWLGAGLIFGSAFTYAVYLMGSGELIPKLGSMRYTSYAMIVSTAAVCIHYVCSSEIKLFSFSREVYILSTVMAVFSTVIPAMLLSEGIRMIGSGRASIIGSVGPVSTILLAYIFLGEDISFIQIIGTILVLAGVLTVSRSKTASAKK